MHSVSIILPVKNEEKYIRHCLSCILQQTYPLHSIEVLIIDSQSTDQTQNIIHTINKQYPELNIKLLIDQVGFRTAALNQGILAAKNDIIIRIDARSQMHPDYVEKCVNTLQQTGADNVGGMQQPILHAHHPLTQQAIGLGMSHPFGVGNAAFRLGKKSGHVDTVYLGCFWRKLFAKIGLFYPAAIISEDSEMNYRINRYGGKVYLNHQIVVPYHTRQTLAQLSHLYFSYGCARAKFCQVWKTLTSVRQCIPPACLLLLCTLVISTIFSTSAGRLLLASILVYLTTNLIMSYHATYKKLALFPIMLFVFPIIHFSWATGFLYALFTPEKTVSSD